MKRLEAPGKILYRETHGCWSLLWFWLVIVFCGSIGWGIQFTQEISNETALLVITIMAVCFGISICYLFYNRGFIIDKKKAFLEYRQHGFLRSRKQRVSLKEIHKIELHWRENRIVHHTRRSRVNPVNQHQGSILIRMKGSLPDIVFMKRVSPFDAKRIALRLAEDLGVKM